MSDTDVTVARADLRFLLDTLDPNWKSDHTPADTKRHLDRAIARLSARLEGLDICPACAMPIEQGQPTALEGARGPLHWDCAREVSTDGALR